MYKALQFLYVPLRPKNAQVALPNAYDIEEGNSPKSVFIKINKPF
jgi:hypothetical protein